MADPILEKAIARRDAAQREVNKWTNFIDGYRELVQNSLDARIASHNPPPIGQPKARVIRERSRPVARDLPPDSELGKTVAAVAAVLDERGRPMPLGSLYDAITDRGLIITGDKPRDNLGARLYNSGRFKSYGKTTGWWFADRPLPRGALSMLPPRTDSDPSSESGPKEQGGSSGRLFAPADKLNGGVSHAALLSMGGHPTMGR